MKRVELYINRKNLITLNEFEDLNSNYVSLMLRENDLINYIKSLASKRIISIQENPNGRDMSIVYSDAIVEVRGYIDLFKKGIINSLFESIIHYEEEVARKSLEKQKVTRKNKYVSKRIIASGITLITLSTYFWPNIANAIINKVGASDNNDKKVEATLEEEIETPVDEILDGKVDFLKPDEPSVIEPEKPKEEQTSVIEPEEMKEEQTSVFIEYNDRSSLDKAQETKSRYDELIKKYSSMYGLDYKLVTAIATQEQGIHSVDRGSSATGLMQIENAVWLGKQIKAYNFENNCEESFTVTQDMVSDLSYNIKIGCMILQQNLKMMRYNILLGLQSYNMGYGNMMKILQVYSQECNKTIDEIIDDQTDNGWMDYRYIPNCGDCNYIEHVLSWIGDETELNCFKENGEIVSININKNLSKRQNTI